MFVIKNAKVMTVTGGTIEKGAVVVEDGKIAAVGTDVPERFKNAEAIDAAGKVLTPGLIDAHSHAGIYEEGIRVEGWDFNEATDPSTPHLRAIDGINPDDPGLKDAARNGITMLCVVPGSANVIGGVGVVIHTEGRIVDEMVIKDAGLKVAFGENPKRVYSEQKKAPTTRMAVAAILRQNLLKAQIYLDKLNSGEGDKKSLPDKDLGLEALARVLKKEMPLRAHAHRADDIMTAIRIADEFKVDLVIEHATEGHKVAEELAKRAIPTVVGPSLTARSKVELRERTFATPALLTGAGVKVALTLDHPVVPVMYLPVAGALAVREGLSAEDALRAMTINAAEVLGVEDRYGSITPGKQADLVLWSGDPLDIRTRAERVWIDGNLVTG